VRRSESGAEWRRRYGGREEHDSGDVRLNSAVRRVAVIGAGAAGLAAGRALREVGLEPVILEQTEVAGGLWVYRRAGAGPAYRSLRTNTSKQITAFSNAPFAAGLSDFPGREEVEAYLLAYGADLIPSVRFGCEVRSLQQVGDGQWELTLCTDGRESIESFDAVLVCSGIFRRPVMPVVSGQHEFTGQVLHSMDYRTPEEFAGQTVLVVGLGSSAVDIATDLLGAAARVALSVRRGAWVAPRTVHGRPRDRRGTRLTLLLPGQVRAWQSRRRLLREYARRGVADLAVVWERANVPFDPATAPSVTSQDLLSHIISGDVCVHPHLVRFDGAEAMFADGSRERPDTVIFCTGYDLDFPFLSPALRPWTEAGGGLYRLVFPPAHPSLAFIGVCRVQGPIFPILEMQARWAARVLIGEARLPSPAAMYQEIKRRRRTQQQRGDSLLRVGLIPYLDQVSAEIGVRPHLWRHPSLLLPLLTGPPMAAQYRLEGPDRWAGAAEAIRAANT